MAKRPNKKKHTRAKGVAARRSGPRGNGPAMLFADPEGNLYDHPTLEAVVMNGTRQKPARDAVLRPLPSMGASASVASLPGRLPVGFDPASGRMEVVEEVRIGGRSVRPVAVAALFPPGWTRTHLPAFHARGLAPVLPLYAYSAAGWAGGGVVAAGVRTDPRTHWDPEHYNTADLDSRIRARLAEDPKNKVLLQVAHCALQYRCFTAQNTFYRRWEAAIPMSSSCNAQCVGCISEQDPETGPPPSQFRIALGPDVNECVRVAVPHLDSAGDGAIVSWGQGCEGEPTLRADAMAEACRVTRRRTSRGTLHVNTNGSRPEAMVMLAEAGLDSARISLNLAEKKGYEDYYRPTGYAWEDVARGVRMAKEAGLFVSLNLLVFPGVSDSPAQANALIDFVSETRPHLIQTRNLCIDPDSYLASIGPQASDPIGMENLLTRLLRASPGLKIGNYNIPKEEWDRPLLPPGMSAAGLAP